MFEDVNQDRGYVVSFGRERIDKIHEDYPAHEGGDCFVVFNSDNILEIGIQKGNAHQLLGLGFESPVQIRFEDPTG
jgi:hypothetical protein